MADQQVKEAIKISHNPSDVHISREMELKTKETEGRVGEKDFLILLAILVMSDLLLLLIYLCSM